VNLGNRHGDVFRILGRVVLSLGHGLAPCS
jgi:hypothetical protein